MTDDLVEAARKHLDALAGTDPDLARCARLITPAGNGGDDGSKSVDEGESEGERKETLASLRVPGARAAVVQRHAASLWPYKLVAWVLENLLRRFPVTPPSTTTSNPSHSGAAPERRRPTFNLQTNTAALSLQRLDDGHGTPASSGATSARWIVHTSRGQIAARRAVLLATNGYTSHLLPGFRDLIVPVRGQMSALLPPELSSQPPQMRMEEGVVKDKADEEKRLVLKSSYVFFAHGNAKRGTRSQDDYLVQRPVVVGGSGNEATAKGGTGGELMFGGGRAQSAGAGFGEWDDSSIDSDVALYLRRELCQVLDMRPGAVAVSDSDTPMPQALPTTTRHGDCTDELRAVAEWTGIMGYSVDGSPWVGPVPDALGSTSTTTHLGASTYRTETDGGDPLPGLYVCAGYTGHGMPNAALCARAVALMVAGDVTRLVGGNDDDKAGTLLSLARDVGLPDEHLLTADRVRRARSGQIELDLWSCKEALVPSGGPPGLELCGLCKAERKNLD